MFTIGWFIWYVFGKKCEYPVPKSYVVALVIAVTIDVILGYLGD